jgi:hypothetical protein
MPALIITASIRARRTELNYHVYWVARCDQERKSLRACTPCVAPGGSEKILQSFAIVVREKYAELQTPFRILKTGMKVLFWSRPVSTIDQIQKAFVVFKRPKLHAQEIYQVMAV